MTAAIRSSDGTQIAYETTGEGPPLILVDGAFCYRGFGPSGRLAPLLRSHFTVYVYDRRGRGESGDTQPWSPEREVDDLAALIAAAGGPVGLFGQSSGAALALEAADRVPAVAAVAGYEPPYAFDPDTPAGPDDFVPRLEAAVAAGRRDEAVAMFLGQMGLPDESIAGMREQPMWASLAGVAHTIPYDLRLVSDDPPEGRWPSLTAPALMMAGGESEAWMQNAARIAADVLPNGQYRSIEGQTHELEVAAIAPVLIEWFGRALAAPAPATA